MTFEHAQWEVIKLGRFRITVHFTKLFGPHLNCRRIYETLSFHYSLSLVHILICLDGVSSTISLYEYTVSSCPHF